MDDESIRQGETLRLSVTVEEAGAVSAELFAYNDTDDFGSDAEFEGLVAVLTTTIPEDQPTGDYEYYIRVFYDDGTSDVLPDSSNCDDGTCDLPIITVCELNQPGS